MVVHYAGQMDLSDPMRTIIPTVDGRVLQVLARSGLPLTGHQAAALAKASPERVRQILLRLRDDGLVRTHRAGSAVMYEANRKHVLWPGVSTLVHACDSAVFLLKHRIREALDDLDDLAEASSTMTIALFGSVARGEAGASSDVDVLLIVPDQTPPETAELVIATIIDTVDEATGNECNVLTLSRTRFDEMASAEDPLVRSLVDDADVFGGPDFRRRLRGAPWDEPVR